MKKLTCLGLSLALAVGLLAGCGNNNAQSDGSQTRLQSGSDNTSTSTTALSGIVNTDGSTSMKDVMEVFTEVFEEANPGVKSTTPAPVPAPASRVLLPERATSAFPAVL